MIHGKTTPPSPAPRPSLAGAIEGAELHIIEGQGHFPHLEAPQRFNPVLAEALGIPADLVPAR